VVLTLLLGLTVRFAVSEQDVPLARILTPPGEVFINKLLLLLLLLSTRNHSDCCIQCECRHSEAPCNNGGTLEPQPHNDVWHYGPLILHTTHVVTQKRFRYILLVIYIGGPDDMALRNMFRLEISSVHC